MISSLVRVYKTARGLRSGWPARRSCGAVEAASFPTAGNERPFNAGYPDADCRSYCPANGRDWPAVLDCGSPMGHEQPVWVISCLRMCRSRLGPNPAFSQS